MNETVDLTDEVDVGALVALASNIDSLTHIEQEMSGSVTGSPWAMTSSGLNHEEAAGRGR
jgi:hypothetical protein